MARGMDDVITFPEKGKKLLRIAEITAEQLYWQSFEGMCIPVLLDETVYLIITADKFADDITAKKTVRPGHEHLVA